MTPPLRNSSVWDSLRKELDRWTDRGLTATFWLRDDDACTVTPQLERLRALGARHRLNIGLAAIPGQLDDRLVDYLKDAAEHFAAMCHGWKHANYGRKATPGEFGPDRPLSALCDDAKMAFETFASRFGAEGVIFVPPFGRITEALVNALPGIGFAGVSTGPTNLERRMSRLTARMPWLPSAQLPSNRSVLHLDVQIDPIDWRRGTSRPSASVSKELIGHLRLRRNGFISPNVPIGLLTHHLVHDDAVWSICDELLSALRSHRSVAFVRASKLAGRDNGSAGATHRDGDVSRVD